MRAVAVTMVDPQLEFHSIPHPGFLIQGFLFQCGATYVIQYKWYNLCGAIQAARSAAQSMWCNLSKRPLRWDSIVVQHCGADLRCRSGQPPSLQSQQFCSRLGRVVLGSQYEPTPARRGTELLPAMAVRKRPAARAAGEDGPGTHPDCDDDDDEPLVARRRPSAAIPAAPATSSAAPAASADRRTYHDMLMDPSPPEWLKRHAAPTGIRRDFLARVSLLITPSDNPSAYWVCRAGLDVGTTLAQEDGVQRNLETIEFFSGWGVYSYWARHAGLRSREYDARTRNEVENLAKVPGIAYAVYLTNSIVPRGTVLMAPPHGYRGSSEFEFSVMVNSVASLMLSLA